MNEEKRCWNCGAYPSDEEWENKQKIPAKFPLDEWTEMKINERENKLINDFIEIINKFIEKQTKRKETCLMNYENLKKNGNTIHSRFWWDKGNVYSIIIEELEKEKRELGEKLKKLK